MSAYRVVVSKKIYNKINVGDIWIGMNFNRGIE